MNSRPSDDHVAWEGATCPLPADAAPERISLAHGEGGILSRRLIAERIVTRLGLAAAISFDDAARLPPLSGAPVLTTDSFVVSPLFFPGGDIGTLAVNGSVNDLAVAGARPRWLAVSLILEEGLELAVLDRVLDSLREAALVADVRIVAGDTKVVPHGAADGLYITTTGLGELVEPAPTGPASLVVGDELLVSGPIARHGVAVLAARHALRLDPPPVSDCAPLVAPLAALRAAGVPFRAARDATRGGLAAVLHEWAQASRLTLEIDEAQMPIDDEVRGVCELLGLDPLHVACEGTFVLAVPPEHAEQAERVLAREPVSAGVRRIGRVASQGIARVVVRRVLGRRQPLDEPLGALLPRIC